MAGFQTDPAEEFIRNVLAKSFWGRPLISVELRRIAKLTLLRGILAMFFVDRSSCKCASPAAAFVGSISVALPSGLRGKDAVSAGQGPGQTLTGSRPFFQRHLSRLPGRHPT